MNKDFSALQGPNHNFPENNCCGCGMGAGKSFKVLKYFETINMYL